MKTATKSGIGVVLLIAFSLAVWTFWYEPAHFVINYTHINLENWPSECQNLKIVVLSDLHVGSPYNDLDNLVKVVAAANSIQPDLILLAGDFVIHEVIGGHFVPPEPIAKELKNLAAPLGVYAVLGNHDWWFNAWHILKVFKQEGIPVLENQALPLQKQRCNFWLAGIGDYWGSHHDINKALKNVPQSAALLAFTHNPDIFYELPDRIQLTLAGHTHGGQVNLPFLGRLIVPSKYGQKLALGHIAEQNRHLFVTGGIGTSILPVRFRAPPEISVVYLE